MRIAYFTDTYYPEINGVTNTLLRLHKYLDDNNIEHIFFTPQYSEEKSGDYIMRFKGLKVPFRDSSALADAIVRIKENSLLQEKIAAGGLKTARERNWNLIINGLINSYAQVLEQYA